MTTQSADVSMGLLVMYVANMYKMSPATITPPVDQRLAKDWTVMGYLTAQDAIFRKGLPTMAKGQEVCYGIVAKNKTNPLEFIAVIRGTEGITEWIEDAEFLSIPHPNGIGQVEKGFWDIYSTMLLKNNSEDEGKNASVCIAAAIPEGATITIIGHSLGSALATYLAFDLAHTERGNKWVSARLFASPHPGNTTFVNEFDRILGSEQYTLYNYFLDAVPRIPFGPQYAHLPHVTDLRPSDAQARIRFNLLCNHHIMCYCAMLDYQQTMTATETTSDIDASCAACIKGPSSM